MSDVFVDTWAWVALVDDGDDNHIVAQLADEAILESDKQLVTTNFVLDEATTLIRNRVHHAAAVKFRRTVRQLRADGLLRVVWISEADEGESERIFERYREINLSFTDCTSFVVMRELKIAEAFTGDGHFQAMGFVLIP